MKTELSPVDPVSIDQRTLKCWVRKSTKPYDQSVRGFISLNYTRAMKCEFLSALLLASYDMLNGDAQVLNMILPYLCQLFAVT